MVLMQRPLSEAAVPRNTIVLPISRIFFRAMFSMLGGIRVTGAHHVPIDGPALLCPNHISDFDPAAVLVGVSRNDLNALAKSELFDIPLLGPYVRAIGALPIKRDTADRAALRSAESVLTAGRLLLIFPEGRGSPSGRLQAIQSGAILLALKTRAPIIPIGLRGTRNVLPHGSEQPRFAGGGVSVVFGEPIRPESYAHLKHKEALRTMTVDTATEIARLTYQTPVY